MTNPSRSFLSISSANLLHNYQMLQKKAGPTKIIPVVKANAYGHGISFVTKILDEKAPYFAVSILSECLQLISHRKTKFIVMNGPFSEQELIYAESVDFVITTLEQASWILNHEKKIKFWIKINLTMNRLGLSIVEAISILKKYANRCYGLMGHIPGTDKFSDLIQWSCDEFLGLATEYGLQTSLMNSDGLLAFNGFHCSFARAGLSLYGYPSNHDSDFKPVMKLFIKKLKEIQPAPQFIGYGLKTLQEKKTFLCSIGYGDGILPLLAGYKFNHQNVEYEFLKPIMMDLCYLQVDGVNLVDNLEKYICLFGENQKQLIDLSRYLMLIPYVILTNINMRLDRLIDFNFAN